VTPEIAILEKTRVIPAQAGILYKRRGFETQAHPACPVQGIGNCHCHPAANRLDLSVVVVSAVDLSVVVVSAVVMPGLTRHPLRPCAGGKAMNALSPWNQRITRSRKQSEMDPGSGAGVTSGI
jgi:hypothetical protein